ARSQRNENGAGGLDVSERVRPARPGIASPDHSFRLRAPTPRRPGGSEGDLGRGAKRASRRLRLYDLAPAPGLGGEHPPCRYVGFAKPNGLVHIGSSHRTTVAPGAPYLALRDGLCELAAILQCACAASPPRASACNR